MVEKWVKRGEKRCGQFLERCPWFTFSPMILANFLTDDNKRYAQLFREAQAVGELRADRDPQALADFYLDSFEGALLRAKVSKSPAPLRLFLTCMFDGVLQGRPAGA